VSSPRTAADQPGWIVVAAVVKKACEAGSDRHGEPHKPNRPGSAQSRRVLSGDAGLNQVHRSIRNDRPDQMARRVAPEAHVQRDVMAN